MTIKRNLLRALFIVPALALAIVVLPAEGQTSKTPKKNDPAKNLDIGLIKQAPKIVSYLSSLETEQDKPYRNVAVLPFKVKKGTRQAGYYAGPLGVNLPGRLENALIMAMDDDEKLALRIIRDAAGVASQAKVGSWSRSKTHFDKLFATSYPVAWGTRSVKPDVFLTGQISNEGNRATTTVEVMGFRKDSWTGTGVKMFPVARFIVKTDRALLRDLGHSFALARGMLKRDVTADQRDEAAVQQVRKEEDGEEPPPQGGQTQHSPASVAGIAFDIFYNGTKQTIRPLADGEQGAKSPVFQVDPVLKDTKVTMTVTRVTGEGDRLGVVLKINGVSTFGREDSESIQCRKWLYDTSDKGTPDLFEGIYTKVSWKNFVPFRVPSADESDKMATELGEKAGWITIDVFESGEAPDREEQMQVSTRGLARGARKPATLEALREKLMAANHIQVKNSLVTRRTRGGLIVFDLEPSEGQTLTVGNKLVNPVLRGSLSIKYFSREQMNVSD
jgi:hypothetical protein